MEDIKFLNHQKGYFFFIEATQKGEGNEKANSVNDNLGSIFSCLSRFCRCRGNNSSLR